MKIGGFDSGGIISYSPILAASIKTNHAGEKIFDELWRNTYELSQYNNITMEGLNGVMYNTEKLG